ncbi:MAG TPA: guanylate kinase [Peptococcaceae bacterium]|jgi:guanylate kinase|nr:guanylate kinase [Peptococcaceae bacterium]HPZ70849.1 guanylate kinase [Peptococcaceae bacterium]HQD53680.1 guanylate kinase [Peptococcaceae bacterium]
MTRKKMQGNLVVISGPSGVGKGTICRALMEKYNDLALSVSATTRKARAGETDGKEYFFYSLEQFEELIKQEAFLEWAKVFDNYYGTSRAYVKKVLAEGKDCILEIDVQGAMQVKKKCPEAIFIFLVPPSKEELARRITGRGTENEAEIQKRLKMAAQEMTYLKDYQYVVVNDQVEAATEKVRAIILAERCKLSRWLNCHGEDLF